MTDQAQPDRKVSRRAILSFSAYLLLNPIILFASAGTVKWGMAWAYFGISILGTILSRVIAHRKNPGLLEERARYQESENIKPWDKVVMPIAALYGPISAIIIAGLDWRYAWTNSNPPWGQVAAMLVGVFSLFLGTWAMAENPFFSAVVRIQEDRGHTVCSSGPYRIIRHPGYASGILWYLITPIVLDSLWAYIPLAISVIFIVVRTALEDQALQAELPGYQEYALITRHRLLPGIW